MAVRRDKLTPGTSKEVMKENAKKMEAEGHTPQGAKNMALKRAGKKKEGGKKT